MNQSIIKLTLITALITCSSVHAQSSTQSKYCGSDSKCTYISNKHVGDDRVLTLNSSNQLILQKANYRDPSQMWEIEWIDNYTFRLRNEKTGPSMCVDSDTVRPDIRKCGNYSGQQWRMGGVSKNTAWPEAVDLYNLFQTDKRPLNALVSPGNHAVFSNRIGTDKHWKFRPVRWDNSKNAARECNDGNFPVIDEQCNIVQQQDMNDAARFSRTEKLLAVAYSESGHTQGFDEKDRLIVKLVDIDRSNTVTKGDKIVWNTIPQDPSGTKPVIPVKAPVMVLGDDAKEKIVTQKPGYMGRALIFGNGKMQLYFADRTSTEFVSMTDLRFSQPQVSHSLEEGPTDDRIRLFAGKWPLPMTETRYEKTFPGQRADDHWLEVWVAPY